jgi:CRISPR-associated endonuclease/helicase Cas3
MPNTAFTKLFTALTGTSPFPWQQSLYEGFARGKIPSIADLPTGLGKTSVVAIWLIALLTHPDKVPRRLVYVVNRRTVVDQTTAEVERLRKRLCEMPDLLASLTKLCAVPADMPLALSTLRGQFADNREWCVDPARPAVIVGTVDMIGSGLLFSRYTCGFKARPHHAALLGQDTLLVHDEAHLEPAFQRLLDTIVTEQKRCGDKRPMRVLQLSATNRDAATNEDPAPPLRLTKADEANATVRQRIHATKQLRLTPIADEKQLAEKLSELALARRDSGRAVLVFARSVETVQKIEGSLDKAKQRVVALTGTMRGLERDNLFKNSDFLRFVSNSSAPDAADKFPTVYLVATSAGEVGINLSADELICDLSTFESMAQRFGRVNRFGKLNDSTIDVVHPETFKADDAMDDARSRTLDLLRQLNGSTSPHALGQLDAKARSDAFSPPPKIRPATDILFDSWAMTSIRGPLPGRPPVAPYLHGETEWEPPETYIAWRCEVEIITDALAATYPTEELLADFPLKPHELLRDRSDRVQAELEKLAEAAAGNAERFVWLVDEDGEVVPKQLKELLGKDSQALLHGATVLLPPSVGGLSERGLLDGKAEAPGDTTLDVADILRGPDEKTVRCRVRSAGTKVPAEHRALGLRIVRVIDTLRGEEDLDEKPESQLETRYWLWLEAPKSAGAESLRSADESIPLGDHSRDVEAHARTIVEKLALPASLAQCVILAAHFHDFGKRRLYWQRGIGNTNADLCLAKAGPDLKPLRPSEPYRHEFGSLLDAESEGDFQRLPRDEQDLVLHLIAAHHGRARPHFPDDECFDPKPNSDQAAVQRIAAEVPRRFARLQRCFGRWGLAYLESLLRAADYAASAGIKPLSEPTP